MADFGPNWKWLRDLGEGGQGHVFLVAPTNGLPDDLHVAYKVVINGLRPGSRLDRTYLQLASDDASSIFGLKAPTSGVATTPHWLIMVCEACGHVQIFRPDLGQGALNNWQRRRPPS
jgi:hypothetical protein